ncbi:hypothetical protein [Klebsiella pneumoniae IS22]|nr:hypothetical protein [Klebsiella pneumoniae IS22]
MLSNGCSKIVGPRKRSAAGQEQRARSRFMPGGGDALPGLYNTGINLI